MSADTKVEQKTAINTYYRPIIVFGRQRALRDRDSQISADIALNEALKKEKPGAEGYILKVFKVEKEAQS